MKKLLVSMLSLMMMFSLMHNTIVFATETTESTEGAVENTTPSEGKVKNESQENQDESIVTGDSTDVTLNSEENAPKTEEAVLEDVTKGDGTGDVVQTSTTSESSGCDGEQSDSNGEGTSGTAEVNTENPDSADSTNTQVLDEIATLQNRINALPNSEGISDDQIESVCNEAQSIAEEYEKLTEEEQLKVDTTKLEDLFGYFNSLVQTSNPDGDTSASTPEKKYVAQIGDANYVTLQDAIDSAESGNTITLLSDITDSDTLNIAKNKNIVLDLNGKTIATAVNSSNSSKHYYAIENYGTLTINDSVGTGKISSRGIDNYGTLTINNGTFETIDSNNGGANVYNEPSCNLIINGGTFKVTNGQKDSDDGAQNLYNSSKGNILITGGTFESNSKRIYSVISEGTITITPTENVSISGTHGALGIKAGTVTINGGNYYSPEYYGLYVSNDRGTATVTVNSGTFGGNTHSVWIGSGKNDSVDSTIVINNGTFNNPIFAESKCIDGALTVKGGTFVSDVSKYLANDYKVEKEGNLYKVTEKTKVAQIGDAKYVTLQDAIDSVESGNTITLLSDITDSDTLSIDKNIVLDLNGKTIATAVNSSNSSKHYYAIENYGTLTINDSVGTGKISSRGIDNYGTLTINNGTFETIDSNNGGANVYNEPSCNLIINGGTFKVTNGQKDSDDGAQNLYNSSKGNILITGGTFESNSKRIYSVISEGTITITPTENVSISGTHGALGIKAGTVTINGGNYYSPEYYGLYVSNDRGTATVTVNGGSFGGNTHSVWIGSGKNDSVDSTIVINNGTFNNPIFAESKCIDGALTVKGGTYASDVSEYLSDGYKVEKIGTSYKVLSNETTTVEVTENNVAINEKEIIATIDNETKISQAEEGFNKENITTVEITTENTKTDNLTENAKVEEAKEKVKLDNDEVISEVLPLDIEVIAKDTDGKKANITEFTKPIKVTVLLKSDDAEKFKDKNISVVRIHETANGTEYTEIASDAKLEGNSLTFESDKFSTYVLVAKETKPSYKVTYVVNGDSDYGKPTVSDKAPEETTYLQGENVKVANVLTTTDTTASDGTKGTWTFSWDTEDFDITKDTTIAGTWKFTSDKVTPVVDPKTDPTPTTKPVTTPETTESKTSPAPVVTTEPTATPSATSTPEPTFEPTATPSATSTSEPTVEPTNTPESTVEPTTTPSATVAPTAKTESKAVDTSDSSNVMFYSGLLIIAIGGLVGMVVLKKKHQA